MTEHSSVPHPPPGPPGQPYPPGQQYPYPGSHGYPAGPPPGWTPPRPSPPLGIAVTGFVLACVGASFAWMPFLGVLGLLLAIAGVVLGFVGRRRARAGRAGGPRLSFWAVVVGSVGVVLGAVGLLLTFLIVTAEPSTTRSGSFGGERTEAPSGLTTMDPGDYLLDQFDAAAVTGPDETATLGDTAWTVVSVDRDATDAVADLVRYEQRPTAQYVLLEVEVENIGSDTVDISADLRNTFLGGDGLEYLNGCHTGDRSVYSAGALAPGESTRVMFCWDVAPDAIPGARVLLSRYSDRWDPGAVWTLE